MLLVLGLASFLVAGCNGASIVDKSQVKLALATNDFAFDLLKAHSDSKNVFISPFSVSTALSMLYLGADGSTSQALQKVLKYNQYGLSEQEVHETFRSILTKLKRSNEDYQFATYNSVLVQWYFNIFHIYGHAVRQQYLAEIESVDFTRGEDVRSKINTKVEKATNGKIKDFLSKPLNTDTKLFLLNAVYFLGNWEKPFESELTRKAAFYNNGVTETEVDMMYRDGAYQYSFQNDLHASIVVLPYKGNTSSLIVVLPDDKTGIAELQQNINQEALYKALETTHKGTIALSLPKFSLSYSTDLVEPLTRLGLEELFSDDANLSRIAGEFSGLRVSSIAHKAVIDVNEKGSEAAAATGIEITNKSLPPSVRVDHPFLFFVREDDTGLILFSGRVDEL